MSRHDLHVHFDHDERCALVDELSARFLPTLVELHHTIHCGFAALIAITQKQEHTMSVMDDDIAALTAQVAAEGTVIASAVAAFGGVQAMIADAVAQALAAGATPAQLQALTDASTAMSAQTSALAAAVAAVPAPAPVPEPTP